MPPRGAMRGSVPWSRLAFQPAAAAQARTLAQRYYHEFVDLKETRIDHDLFTSIPVDLMFRYNFVPIQGQNGTLEIALADPRNLSLIDELSVLLQKKLRVKVATLSQISDLLKKTEQSQRVLEEVTEGFTLDVVGDEENPDETLSIDRLASGDSDIAPVIKLVDTTIFNALERRASDVHIETRDQEVAIKYRIDGVLHYAMPPIAKDWHSTIISRIKVMSELDIAERRVPQDVAQAVGAVREQPAAGGQHALVHLDGAQRLAGAAVHRIAAAVQFEPVARGAVAGRELALAQATATGAADIAAGRLGLVELAGIDLAGPRTRVAERLLQVAGQVDAGLEETLEQALRLCRLHFLTGLVEVLEVAPMVEDAELGLVLTRAE